VFIVVLLLTVALGTIAIVSFMQVQALKSRFTAALGNGGDSSLESHLASYNQRVELVDERLGKLDSEYQRLRVSAGLASQKISIVRFNPFDDTGGDQSFSLAVLDAHNSGYVLTSIHSRTGTRVYVKPIDLGKSKYSLSEEERQALMQAEKRVPQELNPKED
jgi:hypothetical protein